MMGADDQPEAGGVMDLGVSQMKEQVTNPPIQDVMQGLPHHGHSVHVQPAGHRDLLAEADLCHAGGRRPRSAQGVRTALNVMTSSLE